MRACSRTSSARSICRARSTSATFAEGVVWATALSGIPPILALWPKLWELKLLRLDREALAWVFFGVGAGLGWLAVWLLPEATEIRHWLRDLVS